MEKTYYFVSDLHLGLGSAQDENAKEELFISFLDTIKNEENELYILGDLFDYWFEYRRVIQRGFFRMFAKLKELTDAGVKIHYLIGNHDFMHRNFFEEELGVKMYNSEVEVTLNGKKFFMGHGDGLIANDLGYKILKKIFRNKFIQWLYSLVHPDLGIWIAGSTSKTSRNYTSQKDYGENDSLFDLAKEKIGNGFDYVLFGHSHARTIREFEKGYYINLGTWLAKPCFGKFTTSFEVIDWERNGGKS